MGSANGHEIKAETCLIMMKKKGHTCFGFTTVSVRGGWSRAG